MSSSSAPTPAPGNPAPGNPAPDASGPGTPAPGAPSGGGTHRAPQPSGRPPSPWATGGMAFAGVLLLVNGVLAILNGIVGIGKDDVYARQGDYVFKFDVSTWGWIHLIVGILVVLAGLGVLRGSAWAKVVGVTIAALAVIANFMWLPYEPVWALIAIGIGIFVIWALCTSPTRGEPRGEW